MEKGILETLYDLVTLSQKSDMYLEKRGYSKLEIEQRKRMFLNQILTNIFPDSVWKKEICEIFQEKHIDNMKKNVLDIIVEISGLGKYNYEYLPSPTYEYVTIHKLLLDFFSTDKKDEKVNKKILDDIILTIQDMKLNVLAQKKYANKIKELCGKKTEESEDLVQMADEVYEEEPICDCPDCRIDRGEL